MKSEQLSERELQIAKLLLEGNSNREIGAMLGISHRTAEAHRASIFIKLSVKNVADLARYSQTPTDLNPLITRIDVLVAIQTVRDLASVALGTRLRHQVRQLEEVLHKMWIQMNKREPTD